MDNVEGYLSGTNLIKDVGFLCLTVLYGWMWETGRETSNLEGTK